MTIKKRIVSVLWQEATVELLREIREGLENQPNREKVHLLSAICEGVANQSSLLNDKLTRIADELTQLNGRVLSGSPGGSQSSLKGGGQSYQINPITDIPYPSIDLSQEDPIPSLIGSAEFKAAVRSFDDDPAAQRALVSPNSRALLYSLIRIARPATVVEIGTFMAATTEAMARALHANGSGVVHTIDPFGGPKVPDIIASWPPQLRARVQFHCMNSMQFFAQGLERAASADLVFVDGHHDYEYAAFDIKSAARMLTGDGFLVIDNISQAGPFMAARDFLEKNPTWREHGAALKNNRSHLAFDPRRVTITATDLCILRAPAGLTLSDRPTTPGEQNWLGPDLKGIVLRPAHEATGTLHIQYVLRTFGTSQTETTIQRSVTLSQSGNEVTIPMEFSFPTDEAMVRKSVEPWFVWEGEELLQLAGPPSIY